METKILKIIMLDKAQRRLCDLSLTSVGQFNLEPLESTIQNKITDTKKCLNINTNEGPCLST